MASEPIKRGNWYYTFDRTAGSSPWVKLSKDKAQAKIILREYENNKARGMHGLAPTMESVTWDDVMKRFEDYTISKRRPRTLLANNLTMKFFNSWANISYLSEFTMKKIEDYQTYRKKNGLSDGTLNRELTTIKSLSKMVALWYGIPNVSSGIEYTRLSPKEVRFLDDNEVTTLLEYLGKHELKHWRICALIALFCGLRRGEVCYLRWKDIDFNNHILHVVAKPDVDWRPKDCENRYLDLPTILYNELLQYLKQTKGQPDDWVIQNDHENRAKFEMVLCASFRKIFKIIKIKGVSFHNLRKTCATKLGESGMSPMALMKVLGHSDLQTVMKYYGVSNDLKSKIMKDITYGLPSPIFKEPTNEQRKTG